MELRTSSVTVPQADSISPRPTLGVAHLMVIFDGISASMKHAVYTVDA